MKIYTVVVKPNSNAFAAIVRFDPEAVVELDGGDTETEIYTITSGSALDHLLDAVPGLIEWDVKED